MNDEIDRIITDMIAATRVYNAAAKRHEETNEAMQQAWRDMLEAQTNLSKLKKDFGDALAKYVDNETDVG